jgi:endonuclease/exonuclease/phosphatase (EEP) superfamily protein YafD
MVPPTPMRILHCLAFCLLAGCSAAAESRAPEPETSQAPTIRVMTYNVNYGIAGDDETVAAIRRGEADVVLLQETNEAWEQALRRELADRWPHMAFRHCCTAGGLAVLSRWPFEDGGVLAAKAGWFPAWRVMVDAPVGRLQLLNVHLRPQIENGSVITGYIVTPPIRVKEIVGFYPELEPGFPTIVAGDFNESPGGGAVQFLEERGFQDALPQTGSSQSTWRWPTSFGEMRLQLDHVVYRRLDLVHGEVIDGGRSDHLPVLAVFALEREKASLGTSSH